MTPALQSLPEVWFVGLGRAGRPADFRNLEPGQVVDGQRVLQDLRDTFTLLRRHRVAATRLVWEFDKGSLLATQVDEVVRCLATTRKISEVDSLWPLLEELQ